MKKSNEVKIRIYRAINNTIACNRFAQGHSDVLNSYGIKKVTSANTSWFTDPDVYIIMVESKSGNEIYGGARFHLKNNEHRLPIEDALCDMDENILALVGEKNEFKTGELCGLWNSRNMSGSGLSILLTRVGVAKAGIIMANKLKLKAIFILCAPWTVKMVKNTGFQIEESVGNKGTFIYPNPDLIATLLIVKDIETLNKADATERKHILDLRINPNQKKIEHGPKGLIEVEYDLVIHKNDDLNIEPKTEKEALI